MAKKKKEKVVDGRIIITRNKKATHDYEIHDRFEAGIELRGAEVKSCRLGAANLGDAWVQIKKGEAWLIGAHISEYENKGYMTHNTVRERRLLLHGREIDKLDVRINQRGDTAVPLSMYFNERGKIKVETGLGVGKKAFDKRNSLKERENIREIDRVMRGRR